MPVFKSTLSERAEAYVRIMTLEGALRMGPLDEEFYLLRSEIIEEQNRLAKIVMSAAYIREEGRRDGRTRRGRW